MTKSLRLFLLSCALGQGLAALAQLSTYNFSTIAGVAGANGSNLNGTGGSADPTMFNNPSGLVIDASGNLIVADTSNEVLRMVSPTGLVSTYAGTPLTVGILDGVVSHALFNSPQNPVADSAGNIYLADYASHTIRKITPGGVVSTVAGSAGNAGTDDGTGTSAKFNHPKGIAVDGSGNLFVTDSGNYTIRKISSTGAVSTLAGKAGTSGSTDGTGSAALFSIPTGIAVDSSGNLYVSDTGNHTIRKVSSSGS